MWPSWKSSYLCERRVRGETQNGWQWLDLCFPVVSSLAFFPQVTLAQKLLTHMWEHRHAAWTLSVSDRIWHPVIPSLLLLCVTGAAGERKNFLFCWLFNSNFCDTAFKSLTVPHNRTLHTCQLFQHPACVVLSLVTAYWPILPCWHNITSGSVLSSSAEGQSGRNRLGILLDCS